MSAMCASEKKSKQGQQGHVLRFVHKKLYVIAQ